jgi:hypothetical protein
MSQTINESVVRSFVRDCIIQYNLCCESFFKSSASKDLGELHRLARNGMIPYKSELAIRQSNLKLHVHGSGYIIEDAGSGLVTRFSVRQWDDSLTFSFGSFDLKVYLDSIGIESVHAELETWLIANIDSMPGIKHISFHQASFFIVTDLHRYITE